MLAAFCGGASTAFAQEATPPSPIVHAQLLIDAPAPTKKGQPIRAGVSFTMPEHWHIYWINPGDSGIPTTLEWKLPENLAAGDIQWPAPERIETSGLVNYGYSNQIIFPVTLTPSADQVVGEVSVKASWLVCKEQCIPESATLTGLLKPDAEAGKQLDAALAKVPQPFNGKANFDLAPDRVTLTITQQDPWSPLDSARFAPVEDGLMSNNAAATVKQVGNALMLSWPRGTADAIATWHGVLTTSTNGKETAVDITASNNAPVAAPASDTPAPETPAMPMPVPPTFWIAIALAFLGGLVLNIMPCVLPILALKALALAKKAQASRGSAAKQGLSYTAGVIASFLLIASGMLALKATGAQIGWGFQLQNPGFVAFLAVIMLLVGANLLGLFHLPILFGRQAMQVNDDHVLGSFLTGALAVMVATPCTAPFMATAIGATLSFPTPQALAVFAALGLGMASPFLLISFWPAARRLLPKPGHWMHRFKQLLAIPMLATAAWLLFVLVQLLQPVAIEKAEGREPYSATRLSELRSAGTPVFVDATAAWCLSCKVNERVALKADSIQQLFRDKHITMMVADWTNSDPEITAYLNHFGRNGVPLYVYYPPQSEPIILPQVLTPSIVKEAIEGSSK